MFCLQYIFLMFYVIEWHYCAKIQLYIWYLIVQGIFLSSLNYSGTSIQGTPSGLLKASVPRLVVRRVFINDFCGQSLFEC